MYISEPRVIIGFATLLGDFDSANVGTHYSVLEGPSRWVSGQNASSECNIRQLNDNRNITSGPRNTTIRIPLWSTICIINLIESRFALSERVLPKDLGALVLPFSVKNCPM